MTLEDGVLSFGLVARDIIGVTQAHIHTGLPDENGPVVAFPFGPNEEGMDGVEVQGTITDADLVGPLEGQTIADLIATDTLYVNVHTLANPAGAIRGDLFVIAALPSEGDGAGALEPELLGTLSLNAGGQFGPANAADVFEGVKIAWLFNATAVSWLSFIPVLGHHQLRSDGR